MCTHRYTGTIASPSSLSRGPLQAKWEIEETMYEELKVNEMHSKDLQFLEKLTSSSNSNIKVWTNGPNWHLLSVFALYGFLLRLQTYSLPPPPNRKTLRCVDGGEDSAKQEKRSPWHSASATITLFTYHTSWSLGQTTWKCWHTVPFNLIHTFHLPSYQNDIFSCRQFQMQTFDKEKKKRIGKKMGNISYGLP